MLERVLDLDPVGVLVVDIVDLENVGLVDVDNMILMLRLSLPLE